MTDMLRVLIAPLVWLAAFSAVYGLHGVLCGRGVMGLAEDLALERALMIGAYGLAILLQVVLLAGLHARRFASPSGFVRFVSRTTGWTGLVATIWSLLPVIATSSCF